MPGQSKSTHVRNVPQDQAARLSWALDTVTREAIARLIEDLDWADWPDVGEHDWAEMVRRAESLCPRQPTEQVDSAYELLAIRGRA